MAALVAAQYATPFHITKNQFSLNSIDDGAPMYVGKGKEAHRGCVLAWRPFEGSPGRGGRWETSLHSTMQG